MVKPRSKSLPATRTSRAGVSFKLSIAYHHRWRPVTVHFCPLQIALVWPSRHNLVQQGGLGVWVRSKRDLLGQTRPVCRHRRPKRLAQP